MEVDSQHCYRIPKMGLPQALEKYNTTRGTIFKSWVEWIFDEGTHYAVVVCVKGHYPFMISGFKEFEKELGLKTDWTTV